MDDYILCFFIFFMNTIREMESKQISSVKYRNKV